MLLKTDIQPTSQGGGSADGQAPGLSDELFRELFGLTTDAEGQPASGSDLRCYAVLDAACAPFLLTGLLETSDLTFQSLFQGSTQEEVQEYAPYLVELDPENSFCARLFMSPDKMGLWESEPGIFLRSHVDFQTLRTHLRKFTRVRDQSGAWYYFRFWDPAIMRAYISARMEVRDTESAHKIATLFRDIIKRIVVSDMSGTSRFEMEAPSQPPYVPFILEQSDFDIFAGVRWQRYKAKLLRILRRDHGGDFNIDPEQVDALSEQAYFRNFRTEIAAYNYVRSSLLCDQTDIDFEAILSHTSGGTPTEHARHLWKTLTHKA